jgi:anthranilate/para-aminobenzoate synthase component II
MLLLIDNYDSFTYNLVHYFGELGADVQVRAQRRAHRAGGDGDAASRHRAVARPLRSRRRRASAWR